MRKAQPPLITPADGGRWMTQSSSDTAGLTNYVEKVNFRREGDVEVRREGWIPFAVQLAQQGADIIEAANATDTVSAVAGAPVELTEAASATDTVDATVASEAEVIEGTEPGFNFGEARFRNRSIIGTLDKFSYQHFNDCHFDLRPQGIIDFTGTITDSPHLYHCVISVWMISETPSHVTYEIILIEESNSDNNDFTLSVAGVPIDTGVPYQYTVPKGDSFNVAGGWFYIYPHGAPGSQETFGVGPIPFVDSWNVLQHYDDDGVLITDTAEVTRTFASGATLDLLALYGPSILENPEIVYAPLGAPVYEPVYVGVTPTTLTRTVFGLGCVENPSEFGPRSISANGDIVTTYAVPLSAVDVPSAVAIFNVAVAEAASAADDVGGGYADDVTEAASSTDTTDAEIHQIVTEAASASDTVDASLTTTASLTETASATDTADAANPAIGEITEAASAADTVDAVINVNADLTEAASAADISDAATDVDALNYFNQIAAVGSTIGSTARTAISDFALGCKADSIWSLLLDVGPVAGDNLTAALVKLKKLSTGWSYTNVNFVGGDYTEATGLLGNVASGKYLNSDVLSGALSSGSTGLGVYDRTTANSTVNNLGCRSASPSTSNFSTDAPYSDNIVYSNQYDFATQLASGSALTGALGFIFVTRTSAPEHAIYRNGSSLASSASVGGTLPNLNIYFFAVNDNGTPINYSSHRLSFLCITAGMDSTQAAALNTRVQALQTALGRNV